MQEFQKSDGTEDVILFGLKKWNLKSQWITKMKLISVMIALMTILQINLNINIFFKLKQI